MNDRGLYQYVHSTRTTLDNSEAIIVNEKNIDTNESNLNVIVNPSRKFWVTKPAFRTHAEKLESELEYKLDTYTCKNIELGYKLAQVLNYRHVTYLPQLLSNPYVYGADIDIETLIKMAYRRRVESMPSVFNIGSLDIETSVHGGNEIIAISYMDGKSNTIYCSVYEPFLKGVSIDELRQVVDKILEEVKSSIPKKFLSYIEFKPLQIELFSSFSELEIIKWIFNKIHLCKPDFVGIWNLGFDIPQLLTRVHFRNGKSEHIMSHPDVPYKYRRADFKLDTKKKLEHFTDRWDWFYLTGYTQFYDAMCLYSRLRKVKGRENSYTLDYISKKVLGIGKLDLGQGETHYSLQANRFPEYVGYNIVDALLTALMDKVTGDVSNMLGIIGPSHLDIFSKQTSQLRDAFYEYCRENGRVCASVGRSMESEYDKLITNTGGAVLDPRRTKGTEVSIVSELPDSDCMLSKFVADIDATSLYPSLDVAFNISRETKLATCISIDGVDKQCINEFFSLAVAPEVNSVHLCSKFFNLPNYTEIDQLFNVN